jgi:hypothetical protein
VKGTDHFEHLGVDGRIKMDLRETVWEGVYLSHLPQEKDKS